METIIYFNFFVNLIIIGYLIHKYKRFYISVNRTVWYKKAKSITLWYKTYESEYGSSATGLFTFWIRNKKIDDWDRKEFNRLNARKTVL